MMFKGSRKRKAWMSWSASLALRRPTVAWFHSRLRRSNFAGGGGPSSPGCGFRSSDSLLPPLKDSPRVRVSEDARAVCMAATRSPRDKRPEPRRARPPPLIQRRRFNSMTPSLGVEIRARYTLAVPSRCLMITAALRPILCFALLTSALPARADDGKIDRAKDPLRGLELRLVGPFVGGRVARVTGVAGDPRTYYA